MASAPSSALPSIRRHRPTDATGLFWMLVWILVGSFELGICFGLTGVFFIVLTSPFFLFWQIKIWINNSVINQSATEWCRTHYPALGNTPVVDLIIAIAHINILDVHELSPSATIDDFRFIGTKESRQLLYTDSYFPCYWLAAIVYEARIRHVDPPTFSGSTLDDVVHFVVNSSAAV